MNVVEESFHSICQIRQVKMAKKNYNQTLWIERIVVE